MKTEPITDVGDATLDPKKRRYPQSKCDSLPRNFWVGMWCGSRNTGKTYSAVRGLKMYEHKPIYDKDGIVAQRIILISPTYDANSHMWDELKYFDPDKDLHESYSDATLQKIIEDIQEQKSDTDMYKLKIKVWRKAMKHPNKLTPDDVADLEHMNWREPKEPDYPNGVVTFLCLDDLVGSDAYRQGRKQV